MSSSLIWGFLASIVLIYSIVAYLVASRFFKPPARRLLVSLVALEILLVVLHVLFVRHEKNLWSWLFNLDIEFTAGAVYSSAQYTLVALVALVIATYTPLLKIGHRLYWGLLALIFTWLCLDEFLSLHESFMHWRSAYTLGGLAVVFSSLAAFWFGFRDRRDVFVPLAIGLVMMGVAGVLLDVLTNDHPLIVAGIRMKWVTYISCDAPYIPLKCRDMNQLGFVEEFLEMGGVSIVLASFVNYLLSAQDGAGMRRFRWIAAGTAAAWLLIWTGKMWIVPAAEAAANSEPAQAEYLDGRLVLTSYHISGEKFAPGDDITLNLYFRSRARLSQDYRLSAHLLPRYGSETLSQADTELGNWIYPTSAWIPGLPVQDTLHLHIPEDAATPRSYWLTIKVWGEGEDVQVTGTDRLEAGAGTIVLLDLPVLAGRPEAPPPIPAQYHFSDGFWLVGYSLPATATAGEAMPVGFWWQTDERVPYELNQFVHLFDASGENVLTYDQAPFGGENFPTVDWPAGMEASARWEIPLPDDLAPGTYDIYTGLYTLPDVVRRDVFDEQGQPVLNNAIHLGQIVIEAK